MNSKSKQTSNNKLKYQNRRVLVKWGANRGVLIKLGRKGGISSRPV
jgi:hypothetical protein